MNRLLLILIAAMIILPGCYPFKFNHTSSYILTEDYNVDIELNLEFAKKAEKVSSNLTLFAYSRVVEEIENYPKNIDTKPPLNSAELDVLVNQILPKLTETAAADAEKDIFECAFSIYLKSNNSRGVNNLYLENVIPAMRVQGQFDKAEKIAELSRFLTEKTGYYSENRDINFNETMKAIEADIVLSLKSAKFAEAKKDFSQVVSNLKRSENDLWSDPTEHYENIFSRLNTKEELKNVIKWIDSFNVEQSYEQFIAIKYFVIDLKIRTDKQVWRDYRDEIANLIMKYNALDDSPFILMDAAREYNGEHQENRVADIVDYLLDPEKWIRENYFYQERPVEMTYFLESVGYHEKALEFINKEFNDLEQQNFENYETLASLATCYLIIGDESKAKLATQIMDDRCEKDLIPQSSCFNIYLRRAIWCSMIGNEREKEIALANADRNLHKGSHIYAYMVGLDNNTTREVVSKLPLDDKMVELMLKADTNVGTSPNFTGIITNGFIEKGRLDDALSIVRKMEEPYYKNFQLHRIGLGYLKQNKLGDAIKIAEMLPNNGTQNVHDSYKMMLAEKSIEMGSFDNAFEILWPLVSEKKDFYYLYVYIILYASSKKLSDEEIDNVLNTVNNHMKTINQNESIGK